jgi:hypothetical protein
MQTKTNLEKGFEIIQKRKEKGTKMNALTGDGVEGERLLEV